MAVIVVLFKAQYINDDSSISSEHIGPSRTAPRTTWQTWIPQGDQKYNLLDTNGRYWIQFVQDIRELYVRHREINPMGLPLLSFRDEEFSILGVLIYTIDNRNSQIRRIVTCMVRLIPQSTNETKCHPPISISGSSANDSEENDTTIAADYYLHFHWTTTRNLLPGCSIGQWKSSATITFCESKQESEFQARHNIHVAKEKLETSEERLLNMKEDANMLALCFKTNNYQAFPT